MKQKGIIHSVASILRPVLLIFLFVSGVSTGQDPKTELFKDADQAMKRAREVEAHIFSPDAFATAEKSYEKAQDGFRRGRNLEDIERDVRMAAVYFLRAAENTRLAHEELKNCIRARTDAMKVDAPAFRLDAWKNAESELNRAVRNLEQNDRNGAQNRARRAERAYREVELESIKAGFLDETRAMIEEGKKTDVRKKAPATLAKSEELVAQSENLLIENRYDTDQVRELARQANYEAKHAVFLTLKIKEIEDTKASLEQVLLESEEPLQKIADRLDIPARFNQGVKPVLDEILHRVWVQQQTIAALKQDVADREARIAALSAEISGMQSRLGELKDKEETLSGLIAQQRLQREKYERVEKLFNEDEAQVLRTGDQVIIRLYGLSFPVGRAIIEPAHYALLSKVQDAFREYPGCGITIEGHTDSYGTDEANQRLSTERAESVKQYLLAAAGMEPSQVLAIGYGESRPIASNETHEGRRRNRRIDIVIHPRSP